MKKIFLFLGCAVISSSVHAIKNITSQPVVWDKTPIAITLSVGQERIITFPGNVRFGYDAVQLNNQILQVQNNHGSVYLLAKQPFESQRVAVKDIQNGKIVLMDITATTEAVDKTPVEIVYSHHVPTHVFPKAISFSAPVMRHKNKGVVEYVKLTRFAAQQLYAPKSSSEIPAEIYRVPLETKKTIHLMQEDKMIAQPLMSWSDGDYIVTAVSIKNTLSKELILNPQDFKGAWKAASFHQATLQPKGQPLDTTTLYLVSDKPFMTALNS